MVYIANIRDRRQITLPLNMLQKLAIGVGDRLSFKVDQGKLIAKPIKVQVIDTLDAIQQAFGLAGVSEQSLQKSGQQIRKKLSEKIYDQAD